MIPFKKLALKIAPSNTVRGKVLRSLAINAGIAKPFYYNYEYQKWIEHTENNLFLPVTKIPVKDKPLFSIVIPFFNTKDKYLTPLINSIVNQTFGDWELIVADASTAKDRSDAIREITLQDDRIKYHKLSTNTGISGNSNEAINYAQGKYIVFCDHDDTLSPHALNEAAVTIQQYPKTDIIYSDEDKISDNGKWRHSPYFKPEWSPHLFLYTNYTNHLSIIRKTLVDAVGGLRSDFDGSQDYDLLLRIHTLKAEPLTVRHIPKVLYHWREADGSTASDYNKKSYAFEAGRRALEEFIIRKKLKGSVNSLEATPGCFEVVIEPPENTSVLVVVKPTDNEIFNRGFLEKIKDSTISDLNVIYRTTFDNTSEYKGFIVEINNTALPQNSNWLDKLIGVLQFEDVKAVSPRILTSDCKNIFDMGIVYGKDGNRILLNKGLGYKDATVAGGTFWVRDVDDLSGNVIAYNSKKKPSDGYYVVWSHIDFINYYLSGPKTYFNNNLQVCIDGRITVNG